MDTEDVVAILPPRATSAREARELVADRCRAWAVEELKDDLALIVTELVVNAIQYAGTDVEVRLRHIAGGVHLEVSDSSASPLRPRTAGSLDESGRGLLLIGALSHRFGVEPQATGKRVWADLLIDLR